MEKFTKMKDKISLPEEENLFSGRFIDVVNYKDVEILKTKDKIAILPYFRDEGEFLMRLEYLPAYQYKNKDNFNLRKITNYLTVITGTIETNEIPEQTIRRELYEESGIIINNLFNFDVEGPLFLQKYSTTQVWVCLLELPINSYRQIKPPTDGSKGEKLSKCIRISLADIDQLVKNDVISAYLVSKLKNLIK